MSRRESLLRGTSIRSGSTFSYVYDQQNKITTNQGVVGLTNNYMKKFLLLLILCGLFSYEATAKKIKTSYRDALVFAYSQANSVYEDDSIKLEIYDQCLWATNKTKKTIFIDLSQCFMVHNGSSFPMFDSKQDEKHASKKGVATSVDEFITIAPATGSEQNATFICSMTTGIYGKYTTTTTPSEKFSEYDKRLYSIIDELTDESRKGDPKGKEYKGTATRHLTEDESINNIGASIAYAFNKRSENWNNVSLSTWVSDITLAPFYIEMPKNLTRKEKRGFRAKETDPAIIHVKADSPFEFDTDKSPIIVCDWEGNYKKGTFNLATTRIAKKKGNTALKVIGAVFTYGATLLTPPSEIYYKSVVNFDGAKADWGQLTYVPTILLTGQDK